MCYYILFFFIAIAMMIAIFPFIDSNTDWGSYPVWLVSLSITTFVLYGIDKLMAQIGGARTPAAILHLLAMLGGFPGGWLGIIAFQHKTNLREHPDFYVFLTFSTLAHAAFISYQHTASG
jgi:uncharacterized membrane protein YsdA (DUF1294 family)